MPRKPNHFLVHLVVSIATGQVSPLNDKLLIGGGGGALVMLLLMELMLGGANETVKYVNSTKQGN